MDCRRFEEELFAADAIGSELSAHARTCDRCAELLQAMATEMDEALVRGVLDRTSGDPCAFARTRICEAIDGGAPDASLQMHLLSCADCESLRLALLTLPRDLADLARRAPDDDFVAEVMALTSERRRVSWWQAVWRRPRLALEGAYVGTLALALVLGPAALARTPVQAIEQLRDVGSRGQLAAAATFGQVADAGSEALQQSRQRADRWLTEGVRQLGEQAFVMLDSLEDFWGRVRGDDAYDRNDSEPQQGSAA